MKNNHTKVINERNFEQKSTLKEESDKEANKVINFKGQHEDIITKLKFETEQEILKNRTIINFSHLELSDLGLSQDWDMYHLEDKTE